jgi:uncharacterized protein DUF4154
MRSPLELRHLLIAVLAFSGSLSAAIEESHALQERVKAAFLYKFAAYVEWPAAAFPAASSPIVIGVAGSEGVARELEQAVAGRELGGRAVQVRRIKSGEAAGACCQILFVGADSGRVSDLLTNAEGQPVLTVTEAQKEHPRGSVINFLALEDRIRFDISREAAEKNRLQLRSQLLSVARQVTPR